MTQMYAFKRGYGQNASYASFKVQSLKQTIAA